MRAIRGAITVDKNTKKDIEKESQKLIRKIISKNNINEKDIISIIFTTTDDLDKIYPAEAIRKIGFKYTPLMCCKEMDVEESLAKCIRVMVYIDKNINKKDIEHIYLKKAKNLRKDLKKSENKIGDFMKSVIAIDGPAGAGKSTIAKKLAKRFNYRYLDTGAMYRAVTWYVIKNNIDISDEGKLSEAAKEINISFRTNNKDGNTYIYVNDKNITDKIRKNKIDKNVSDVAKVSGVRKEMVKIQKRIAENGKIIVDGRDIASRVLPDADLKIYLTASVEERARRRHSELLEKGISSDFEKVKEEIKKRDYIDKNRKNSPLTQTEDAVLIDSTNLSINEVLDKISSLIKEGD